MNRGPFSSNPTRGWQVNSGRAISTLQPDRRPRDGVSYMHTYIYTYIHTCTHTYVHANIHTHIQAALARAIGSRHMPLCGIIDLDHNVATESGKRLVREAARDVGTVQVDVASGGLG